MLLRSGEDDEGRPRASRIASSSVMDMIQGSKRRIIKTNRKSATLRGLNFSILGPNSCRGRRKKGFVWTASLWGGRSVGSVLKSYLCAKLCRPNLLFLAPGLSPTELALLRTSSKVNFRTFLIAQSTHELDELNRPIDLTNPSQKEGIWRKLRRGENLSWDMGLDWFIGLSILRFR